MAEFILETHGHCSVKCWKEIKKTTTLHTKLAHTLERKWGRAWKRGVIEEFGESEGLTAGTAGRGRNINSLRSRKLEHKFSWELPKYGAGH